jgi:hypothetical protein
MRRREAGRGVAPAGSCTQHGHPGGVGAPPVPITRPCQELADDLDVALPAFGLLERDVLTGRGPPPNNRRFWRAERRPRAARHEP